MWNFAFSVNFAQKSGWNCHVLGKIYFILLQSQIFQLFFLQMISLGYFWTETARMEKFRQKLIIWERFKVGRIFQILLKFEPLKFQNDHSHKFWNSAYLLSTIRTINSQSFVWIGWEEQKLSTVCLKSWYFAFFVKI